MTVDYRLISGKFEKLFDLGIQNIFNVIPEGFDKPLFILIESIAFISIEIHNHYSKLESILDNLVSSDGTIYSEKTKERQKCFGIAWRIIDLSYHLSKLLKIKDLKAFPELTIELKKIFAIVSAHRNYVNHLDSGFGNSVSARDWFPVFGWITFQFTPCLRSDQFAKNHYFVVNFASTNIDNKISIPMKDVCSKNVYASIDNIHLFVKKNEMLNISELYVEICLFLSDFFGYVNVLIAEHIKGINEANRRFKVPHKHLVVRVDLGESHISTNIIEISSEASPFNKVLGLKT